jgi:peptidoglycan glycosyltransferase
MFALLFGAISYVQVVGADDLKTNPLNQRAILQNYCNDRGAIIVGGTPVAESVETGSETCKFQRTYSQPELYAGITGYFSQNYGATGEQLAPGSVFKLVDAAAALASGKYNKDSELPNYAGGNCYTRNTADFAFALQQSCNTPFASIALDLGRNAIAEQAKKFGFGEDMGDQLKLGYAKGNGFPDDLDAPGLAQSAIGQRDVRATPLQIAMMTAAIANDGVQMQPTLIKALRSPDLRVIDEPQPQQLRTSTTPAIANQITEWMTSAVSQGIANRAAVPGVQVAGKTGTAELGNGVNNSWFTGFAPANNPQVGVTIVMEGVDITTGAQLTSPNAKKIFEAVLNK